MDLDVKPLKKLDQIVDDKRHKYVVYSISGDKVKARSVVTVGDGKYTNVRSKNEIEFTLADYYGGKYRNLNYPECTVRQMTEEEKVKYGMIGR